MIYVKKCDKEGRERVLDRQLPLDIGMSALYKGMAEGECFYKLIENEDYISQKYGNSLSVSLKYT